MPTGEISTTPIVHDALARGKTVFVPYLHRKEKRNDTEPASVMDMLKLHSVKDFESLKSDNWGIPTFSDDTIHERENSIGGHGVEDGRRSVWNGGLDLILMPGMAFDGDIRRLGHGKGYYDYFLHKYQKVAQEQSTKTNPKGHFKPILSKLEVKLLDGIPS